MARRRSLPRPRESVSLPRPQESVSIPRPRESVRRPCPPSSAGPSGCTARGTGAAGTGRRPSPTPDTAAAAAAAGGKIRAGCMLHMRQDWRLHVRYDGGDGWAVERVAAGARMPGTIPQHVAVKNRPGSRSAELRALLVGCTLLASRNPRCCRRRCCYRRHCYCCRRHHHRRGIEVCRCCCRRRRLGIEECHGAPVSGKAMSCMPAHSALPALPMTCRIETVSGNRND
jgi:hypothetical protein